MNKLKIFLLTSLMVLTSFIGVFADTKENKAVEMRKYYFYLSNGEIITSTEDFYIDGSYIGSKGSWVWYTPTGAIDRQGTNRVIYSVGIGTVTKTNSKVIGECFGVSVDGNNGGTVNPPEVAPIVGKVEMIVPHLLEQLKILLPSGVIIFALLLGMRLVPRLIRLFQ